MALKIIDANESGFPHDGTFGRAHFIFDRDIDANPLRLSLFKLLGQEYLGKSSWPKPNWTPARSHFFDAALVKRGNGQTVFVLGPEVTTFIPPESTLEVASEDNTIRERAVWGAISIDFGWRPPPEPAPVAAPRQVAVSPQPPPATKPEPIVPPPDPPQPPVQPSPITTTTATTDPPPPPKPPGPPPNWGLRALLFGALALVAGAAYAAYCGAHNRDQLCDRYNLFCDAEVIAYHAAQSCAASKSCGASSCVESYRNTYPNGRFKSEIDDIAVRKGRPCQETLPPPREDPERLAYERVMACAAGKTCGASVCTTEYRQMFPNGAHKADVDQIVAQKGGDCAEKDVFERAVSCALPKSCGAGECLAEYRRRFPNGPHKADIDQIALSPRGQSCAPVPDLDREAYDRAVRCAAPLGCGADHCLIEYRRDFANGRYRALIEQIGTQKGAACQQQQQQAQPDLLPPFVRRTNEDAGINCARTNLEPIAQMICADADMARANHDLQIQFDQAAQSLRGNSRRGTPEERGFRDREKEWIESRDQQCNIPKSGTWSEMDLRRLKGCFLDKTRARINDLRQ